MSEISEIAEIGILALKESKRVHDQLGIDGLTPVPSPNQFGEQALKADVEAEKVVLETLRRHHLPIRVISEEHGTTDVTDNPEYLGVLDGIDGTSVLKRLPGKGRYGTMFGIFEGINPRYQDYLFAGIMEHATNRLWMAAPNRGSCLIVGELGTTIRTSQTTRITGDTKIYVVDSYNDYARQTIEGLFPDEWTKQPLSAAISYVDISSGKADLEVEVTRKGNLEQMIAYGLIKEAGGVMVDVTGQDIGRRRYFSFGQRHTRLLITAATQELAIDARSRILARGLPRA